MPYEPGPKVISRDDHGDPVYEDIGLTPAFRRTDPQIQEEPQGGRLAKSKAAGRAVLQAPLDAARSGRRYSSACRPHRILGNAWWWRTPS